MIEINEKSSTPIYQQIYESFIKLIVLKILVEGEKLPSVRELALLLKINPNTIQKAYKALEHDQFIVSQKGKGNFVNPYKQVVGLYKKDIEDKLKLNLKAMMSVGESKETLMSYVNSIMEEIENDRD